MLSSSELTVNDDLSGIFGKLVISDRRDLLLSTMHDRLMGQTTTRRRRSIVQLLIGFLIILPGRLYLCCKVPRSGRCFDRAWVSPNSWLGVVVNRGSGKNQHG